MPCINVVRWALQACSAPGTRSPGFRGDADANTIQPISISTVERSAMDLIADRGRRVAIEELNTTRLLAHARKQAQQRKLDDILIVDVDAHHYENESLDEFLPFMENDVLRQLTLGGRAKGRGSVIPTVAVGFQEMGGRITRYSMRSSEKTAPGKLRDVELGHRWMDAMSVDYSCLFPTLMLAVGLHPDAEMEVELCWAYNRWLTEKALPEGGGRFYSMLTLPLSDPDAALRQIETFGTRKYVTGFMITCVRSLAVHHNAHMKIYRALEERGLALAFHSAINPGEPVFKNLNRFASVHALGFPFYNILHMTNWVTNGLGERFPKLPVIWIEGGLAWVPFLMQRLDHEYMLRSSEYPLLKKKPSDYMRAMYYASQPMEAENMRALACTFEMINAETQLLYASDYPHWDFDLPSRVWDLPFLSEKAKHNILGGTAARLFKLPPRSEQQRANLERFGAVAA
jgi:predicted TIM-barrel fold metal-dependent hydrolase